MASIEINSNGVSQISIAGTPTVNVGSSGLPTGASTSALQTSGNASLTSIDGKLPALSGGQVPTTMTALPTNNSIFRDEFDGSILDTSKWTLVQTGSGMAVSTPHSFLRIKTGTTANSETIIRSVNKYSFESLFKWASMKNLSQLEQELIVEVVDTPPTKFTSATWTKITNSNFNFTSVSASNVLVVNSGTPVLGAYVAGTNIAANSFIMAIDGSNVILNNNASGAGTNNTTSHLSLQIDTGSAHGLEAGNWIELVATSDATVFGYNTAAVGSKFLVTAVGSATSFSIIPNAGVFAGGAGPGTLDFYAYTNSQNIIQWMHDNTTATSGRFQVWSMGKSYTTTVNSQATNTITTQVNPGSNTIMRCNDGIAWLCDLGNISSSGMSLRAARENRVPMGSTEGYVQIRVKNLAAPASNQYIDIDYVRVLEMNEIPVFIAGRGMAQNAKEALSVSVAAMPTTTVTAAGANADDSSTLANPLIVGGRCVNAIPTAATTGDTGNVILDLRRRMIVYGQQVRELVAVEQTTITTSTSETTIAAAVASISKDISSITVANTGSADCNVTIKDSTSGTTRLIVAVKAGTTWSDEYPTPLKQSGTNANWTATCSVNTTTIAITVVSVQS